MKVDRVCVRRAPERMGVLDCFVGRGLLPGGHAALPDIDVDYASDRRQEMKEYLEQRYNVNGRQRVFSAGTFTTLKLKAVLRDVARVHRVPLHVVNYLTKILEDGMDWTGLFLLAARNHKVKRFIMDYPLVIEDIRGLMGQPKSTSIHASAIVVTPEKRDGREVECFDFVPIRKMDRFLVSEFDGYSVDAIGLLKEDVLSTKELSKLSAMIEVINREYGQDYSIERITRNEIGDRRTYEVLRRGFTQHVFQFGSKGITKFIRDVQPDHIEDLIAINALYRPATLEINATEDYVRFKNHEAVPVYDFGTYEATKNTFGIMIYQEQFMEVAHRLAGFDPGKCDYLRKAIGKKNAELMATLKADFIAGAIGNGCPDYEAEQIWHKIEVAGKYSFNRSHAAAYALTAFCGAWVKANYPTVFYTEALQWADDDEIPVLMGEMMDCSVAKVVHPDINMSGVSFFTDYGRDEIFWSLTRIRMLGGKAVEWIVAEREKNGAFTSVENFTHRIFRYKLKRYEYWDDVDSETEVVRCPVNARHVLNLILSGCFDRIENVGSVVERYGILERAAKELGFEIKEKDIPADLRREHYFWTQQQIGISGVGSTDYKRVFDNCSIKAAVHGRAGYMALRSLCDIELEGKYVTVCGMVVDMSEVKYRDKKSGEAKVFCKIRLQQNIDLMDVIVWNDDYVRYRGELLNCKGKLMVASVVVRYSDFDSCNVLQFYRNTVMEVI